MTVTFTAQHSTVVEMRRICGGDAVEMRWKCSGDAV
jgi:hypothetical protein